MDTKTTTQTDEAQPRLAGCLGAEFLGTFLLVLGGTGTAVLAATVDHGVGYLGVALAFGLTVVVGAYAFGPVSGGHFNPAVSIGLATAGRFPWRRVPAYIAAQLVGAITASRGAARHRLGPGWLQPLRGLRHERLRRPLAGGLRGCCPRSSPSSCSPRCSCSSSLASPGAVPPPASHRSRSA
jgi:hypothetical protein